MQQNEAHRCCWRTSYILWVEPLYIDFPECTYAYTPFIWESRHGVYPHIKAPRKSRQQPLRSARAGVKVLSWRGEVMCNMYMRRVGYPLKICNPSPQFSRLETQISFSFCEYIIPVCIVCIGSGFPCFKLHVRGVLYSWIFMYMYTDGTCQQPGSRTCHTLLRALCCRSLDRNVKMCILHTELSALELN